MDSSCIFSLCWRCRRRVDDQDLDLVILLPITNSIAIDGNVFSGKKKWQRNIEKDEEGAPMQSLTCFFEQELQPNLCCFWWSPWSSPIQSSTQNMVFQITYYNASWQHWHCKRHRQRLGKNYWSSFSSLKRVSRKNHYKMKKKLMLH
jgi:hypothetical protein